MGRGDRPPPTGRGAQYPAFPAHPPWSRFVDRWPCGDAGPVSQSQCVGTQYPSNRQGGHPDDLERREIRDRGAHVHGRRRARSQVIAAHTLEKRNDVRDFSHSQSVCSATATWGVALPGQKQGPGVAVGELRKSDNSPSSPLIRPTSEKAIDSKEKRSYQGRVVDPEGRPFAGAELPVFVVHSQSER